MASKIFVVCALVCAIQGLNGALIRPGMLLTQSLETEMYKDSMTTFQNVEAEYSEIVNKFEDVVNNELASEFAGYFDEILEPLENFDGSDMVDDKVDREVVRKCIREQIPNMKKFAMEMRTKVVDAGVQLRQFIVDTLGSYIVNARVALRDLVIIIADFAAKMREYIQQGNIFKIIELIQKTTPLVSEKANEIKNILAEARNKFPLVRQKAMQLAQQLRKEAETGVKTIRKAISECIANGGPKELLAQVPVVVPVAHVPVAVPVAQAEEVSTLIATENAVNNA